MKTTITTLVKDDIILTFCGAVHIGTPDYYKKLNYTACLSQVVIYELLKVSEEQRQDSAYRKSVKYIAELCGLELQSYTFNSKYINADIHKDVFGIICDYNLDEKMDVIVDKIKNDKDVQKAIKAAVLFILKHSWILKTFSLFRSKRKHAIVNMRNYVVVAEILKQLETHKEISVIYGEGHIPHLIEQFTECGFVKTSVAYLDNLEGMK